MIIGLCQLSLNQVPTRAAKPDQLNQGLEGYEQPLDSAATQQGQSRAALGLSGGGTVLCVGYLALDQQAS